MNKRIEIILFKLLWNNIIKENEIDKFKTSRTDFRLFNGQL